MNIIKMKLANKGGGGSGGGGMDFIAWESLSGSGTDMFGEFTIKQNPSSTLEEVKNGDLINSYCIFKEGFDNERKIADLSDINQLSNKDAFDLTHLPEDAPTRRMTRCISRGEKTYSCYQFGTTSRLILPETFWFTMNMLSYAPAYTYLPKKIAFGGTYHYVSSSGSTASTPTKMSASWVGSTSTTMFSKNVVKCPKDAEIPYYLNKFPHITAEDMVGIFENMIDRSGETTVATITLGTDNLAKLTEEQMDIARAKGWSLA